VRVKLGNYINICSEIPGLFKIEKECKALYVKTEISSRFLKAICIAEKYNRKLVVVFP
jgi:hypothetical protein